MKKRRRISPSPTTSPLTESELEQKFYNLLLRFQSPVFLQQYRFHPARNWRFDFCWPQHKVAVEIQGYGPGHNSLQGMQSDYEKHNAALMHGWKILYFMAKDLDVYNQTQTIALLFSLLEVKNDNRS